MKPSEYDSAPFSPTKTEQHDPISASAFYTTTRTQRTESASPMDVDEPPTATQQTVTTRETTSSDPQLLVQPSDENDSDIEMKDAERATSDVDESNDESDDFPDRKWDLDGTPIFNLEDVPSGPSIPAEFHHNPTVHPNAPPRDTWPRNEAGIAEKFRCEHATCGERSWSYDQVINSGLFCCREPLENGESIVVMDQDWVVQVWGVVCCPGSPVRVRVLGLETRHGNVHVSVPGVITHFNEYVNVRFWFNGKCFEHQFFHDDPRLEMTNPHKKRIVDNLYEEPVTGKMVEYFDVGAQNLSFFSPTQTTLDDHFSKLSDLDLMDVICGAAEVLPRIDQGMFSQEEFEHACRRVYCSQCRRRFFGIDDMTFHEHPLECFRKSGRMVCKACIDWWATGNPSSGRLNCNTDSYDKLCRGCGTSDNQGVVSCSDCEFRFCVGCMMVHMNEDLFSKWLEKPGDWESKGWKCFNCDQQQIAANQNWYKRSRLPDFCGSIELINEQEEVSVFHSNMIDSHILFNKMGELWRDNFNVVTLTERSAFINEAIKMIVSSLFVGYEGRQNPETGGAMQYLIGCLHNANKLWEHHHQEFSSTQRASERPFLKEWIWRIYVDAFAKNDALVNIVLKCLQLHPFVELVEYNFPHFRRRDAETYDEHEGLFGTFIRFHALAEPFLRIAGSCVAIRDIDNLYTHIDFGNLEKWLAKGEKTEKPFHRYYCPHYGNPFWYGDKKTIDARIAAKELSPQQYGGYPLLAGLFASQAQIPQIMDEIFEYCVRLWRYPWLHPDHIRSTYDEESGFKVTPFLYACDQFFLDDCIFQEMCARKAEYFETVGICVDRTIASDECRGANRGKKNKSYLSIPKSRHNRQHCGAANQKLSRVLKLLNISNDQRAHAFFTHHYSMEDAAPHMAGENLGGMIREMRGRYGRDDEKEDSGGGVFELYGRYDEDLSCDFERMNLCEGVDPRGLNDGERKALKKGLFQKAKGWELNDARCEVLQKCLELGIEKAVSVALFQRISWLSDEQLLEIVTRVKKLFVPEPEEN